MRLARNEGPLGSVSRLSARRILFSCHRVTRPASRLSLAQGLAIATSHLAIGTPPPNASVCCPRKASFSRTTPAPMSVAWPLTSDPRIHAGPAVRKPLMHPAKSLLFNALPHRIGNSRKSGSRVLDASRPTTSTCPSVTISIHNFSIFSHTVSTGRQPVVHGCVWKRTTGWGWERGRGGARRRVRAGRGSRSRIVRRD